MQYFRFLKLSGQLTSNPSLPGNEVFRLSVYFKIENFEEKYISMYSDDFIY